MRYTRCARDHDARTACVVERAKNFPSYRVQRVGGRRGLPLARRRTENPSRKAQGVGPACRALPTREPPRRGSCVGTRDAELRQPLGDRTAGARVFAGHARGRLACARAPRRRARPPARLQPRGAVQQVRLVKAAACTPLGRPRLLLRASHAHLACVLRPGADARPLPSRRAVPAFPPCSLVESSRGANPALEAAIQGALGSCVTETDLGLPGKRVVRGSARPACAPRN